MVEVNTPFGKFNVSDDQKPVTELMRYRCCANCIYGEPISDDKIREPRIIKFDDGDLDFIHWGSSIECRFNPPVQSQYDDYSEAKFPLIDGNEWCYRFVNKHFYSNRIEWNNINSKPIPKNLRDD
jgi:hypothetical protein